MANQFCVNDQVDWADDLDGRTRSILLQDFGPGPFFVYKTKTEKDKQYVTLGQEINGKRYVLEDRDQLFILVEDEVKNPIPTRISARLLKKI